MFFDIQQVTVKEGKLSDKFSSQFPALMELSGERVATASAPNLDPLISFPNNISTPATRKESTTHMSTSSEIKPEFKLTKWRGTKNCHLYPDLKLLSLTKTQHKMAKRPLNLEPERIPYPSK
ncbi:Hypothetical predicted protein [Octopus vulgaris]|uniref:Uncharacterized protein n=1 Tax=Octopus vulgaris TaxID=6645 RepID=A0AA36F3D2_OCTVU|nr:Hypothetical predicted protein [Octopus vulgaris]